MGQQIDISQASVYVGTYYKYNNGSIFGKWLKLSDFSDLDEFYSKCREIHKGEDDPEFMFQDFENIPEDLISECFISDKIFEIFEALENIDKGDIDPFFIWCNGKGNNLSDDDIDDLINSFRDDFMGSYNSEEDFASEYFEQCYDVPENIQSYIDYEAFARDIFSSDFWYDDGYVFRNS